MLTKDPSISWSENDVECSSPIEWGIAEQANGSFAVLVDAPGGLLSGKQMRTLAEIVGDDGV